MSSTESDTSLNDRTAVPAAGGQQQPWALDAAVPAAGGEQRASDAAEPVYAYPMLVKQGRVRGLVSDFRDGQAVLSRFGVTLEGQALTLPAGTRDLILVLAFFTTTLFGAALASIILERIRSFRREDAPWDLVDEVVLQPKQRRACIVYALPVKPKQKFSLAFKPGGPEGETYENFEQAARFFAPDKVREGRIGSTTSPLAWAILAIFLVLIVLAILFAGRGN